MKKYIIQFVPDGGHSAVSPNVTIHQLATMLAHQNHSEYVDRSRNGKYKWYDESLVAVEQYIQFLLKIACKAMAKGNDLVSMTLTHADGTPMPVLVLARYTAESPTAAGEKCRAYRKALNDYWLNIEAGINLQEEAPDIKDFLYHPLSIDN